jgi:UDP-2,3-diacylglucosamine pyrophosphatase LpxH
VKRFTGFIVLLLLLAGSSFAVTDRLYSNLEGSSLVQPEKDRFSFAVLGDFRPARRDLPYADVFARMLEEVSLVSPDLVMSTGDAYYGYGGSFQRFRNEVSRFLSEAKAVGVPFFNITGNHEVTQDAERERYAKEVFGKFYGSFDYGSSHFIVLNTEERGKEGLIAGEQLDWLKRDLEANKNASNLFVFLHRPLFSVVDPEMTTGKSFSDKANRDSLHELFRQYRVKAVLAGHEHLFDDRTKDGVRYFIVGGGGSPLAGGVQKGGFFQYMIITVQGSDVTIDTFAPFGLQVRSMRGNDGLEAVSEIELLNSGYAALELKSLDFIMPMNEAEGYRVTAVSISNYNEKKAHPAEISGVKDNEDGTATVSVGVVAEGNGYYRIVVESDVDK